MTNACYHSTQQPNVKFYTCSVTVRSCAGARIYPGNRITVWATKYPHLRWIWDRELQPSGTHDAARNNPGTAQIW